MHKDPAPPTLHSSAAAPAFDAAMPLLFVLLWSTGFIGARLGLPDAGPLTFLSLRYAIVIVLMGALAWWLRAPWPSSWRVAGHIAVSGLLVHAVYLGGVFTAIAHGLPAGLAALVVGLQPLLTALGARVFLHEQVRPVQWAGLALGVLGVALVVAHKAGTVPTAAMLGMLAPVFVALLGITAGTLYQKRFCPSFDLRSGSVLQFFPSLVLTAGVALLTEEQTIRWSGEFVFALAWLVLVLSLGAVNLLNLLIRRGSAVHVASLFYLTPPATALIAWLMFDERLGPTALLGMGLAAVGVWLARQPLASKPTPTSKP
jgi:drug/metabolite transporter (DMT)-like permease